MSWRSVAFDWNRARAFLVTVEEGSFSAAARALGLAQPTLGRQVAALEEELGVTLFSRVGNHLELSASGLELIAHVRQMGEAATRVALSSAGQASSIDGLVRIAASQVVAAYLVAPIVEDLRREHNGIEIELVVSNRLSDLRRRDADIAVRHVRPDDPDLIAKQLRAASPAWMYATPAYLDRIGNPRTQEQLSEVAEVFGFDDSPRMRTLLNGRGYAFSAESFPVRTEDQLVQWEMAKRGMGICIMMEEVGETEPAVTKVLPDEPAPLELPTWLTTHRELHTSQSMRLVFDRLATSLFDGR
jgi:DNA-binding transcriptional LysR family regulator